MPHPTFQILYEDPNLIVLDKPAGLLSQGDVSGEASLVDALRLYLGRHYVGLVHRLDRNTSGVMVVAKRSKAAERLTTQLQDGRLSRTYLAWLEGRVGETGTPLRYDNWLLKDEGKNETQALAASEKKPHPDAKRASLTLEVLQHSFLNGQKNQPMTLCRFTLETGRSHQIRAQSAFHGHPLVGDRKYGSRFEHSRPALHSSQIQFEHPISHEVLTFECEPPQDFPR